VWNIIGHEAAVFFLQRGLEKNTTAHAYLFVGPAHIGKMTLAINLAQAVNCNSNERPCGICDSCRRISESKHADIQTIKLEQGDEAGEITGKTRISVEQIDQILHSVNLPPFEGRYKVFIIDGLEFLSIAAANRMLKTLEEPIGNVIFILLAANEAMVPATIVSRCQRIELFPVALSTIEKALVTRWKVEPEKARLLSRLSAGCPGWAVTMIQNDALLQQRNEWLDEWLEIMENDMNRRFTFVAKMTEKYFQNRETVQQRLVLLLGWWRDVLLVKVGNTEAIINVDRVEKLEETAATSNLMQIRHFISSLESTLSQLHQNVNPQLALEFLMLNVPERGKVKKGTIG
jgi:DNA polymerase III subunit delta'